MTARSKLRILLGADWRKIYQFFSLGPGGNRSKEMVICPFHQDTLPSLAIDFEAGFAYCFSCVKGWDALEFVKDIEKTGVRKALWKLAEILRVDLTKEEVDEMCQLMLSGKPDFVVEEPEKLRERRNRKVALEVISIGFSHKINRLPGRVKFRHYIDACYSDFDTILALPITPKSLDKLKGLVKEKHEWLSYLLPELDKSYRRLKREGQQERTGEFLGVYE